MPRTPAADSLARTATYRGGTAFPVTLYPEATFSNLLRDPLYRRDVCGSWRALTRGHVPRAIRRIRFASRVRAQRQKWPISTDRRYSRAKSALSHTPMLSLNCFGKALTYPKARTKITKNGGIAGPRQKVGCATLFFLCVPRPRSECLWAFFVSDK